MIKLVIFDLDGTLLYTLDSIAKSANHILADYGYEAIETDVYRHYVGDGIYELLDRAFSHAGETVKVTDEMVLRFRSYFKEDRNFHKINCFDHFPYRNYKKLGHHIQDYNSEKYHQFFYLHAIYGHTSHSIRYPESRQPRIHI